jgi:predicted amino acid-binding ACT domain protein
MLQLFRRALEQQHGLRSVSIFASLSSTFHQGRLGDTMVVHSMRRNKSTHVIPENNYNTDVVPRKEWPATSSLSVNSPLIKKQEHHHRHQQKQPTSDAWTGNDIPRTSVLMELPDRVGMLHDVLRYFWKHEVNICRIESRPLVGMKSFDFFVDFEGSPEDSNVSLLLQSLKPMTQKLLMLDEKKVNWFPRHISEYVFDCYHYRHWSSK